MAAEAETWGRCAQPCRLPYKVYDDGKLISSADERYALSPKDNVRHKDTS